jgi:hypothetical protein
MTEARKKIDAIHNAKDVLKESGFFVDNLWTIRDVQDRFECDENTAQEILYKALTNEWVMDQIWQAIHMVANYEGLKFKED